MDQQSKMLSSKKNILCRFAILATILVLNGCSAINEYTKNFFDKVTPYKVTVIQGNFVSEQQADQLQKGMTRQEVIVLLGQPLIADIFHQDRWDYLFYFKRGHRDVVPEHKLTLNFKDDYLESWSKPDGLLTEYDLLDDIDEKHASKQANVKQANQTNQKVQSNSVLTKSTHPPADHLENDSIPLDIGSQVQTAPLSNKAVNLEANVHNSARHSASPRTASHLSNHPHAQVQRQFQFTLPEKPVHQPEVGVGPQAGDEQYYNEQPNAHTPPSDAPPQRAH